jgi:hypothetical protein
MDRKRLNKLYAAHLALAVLLAVALLAEAVAETLLRMGKLDFTEAQGYGMLIGMFGAPLILVAGGVVLCLSGAEFLRLFRREPSCLGPQNPALLFLSGLLLVTVPVALLWEDAGVPLMVLYPLVSLPIGIRWLLKRRSSPEG